MKQRIVAEFLGTTFLLVAVVGSGVMGQLLSGGNEAVALLANSLATGAGLGQGSEGRAVDAMREPVVFPRKIIEPFRNGAPKTRSGTSFQPLKATLRVL